MKNRTKIITNEIVENGDTQRLIFRVLLGSIFALSIVYIYFIGSITFNVLARKTLETSVRTLGGHVSELELTYLDSTNKIDKNYALSLGFVETHQNLFATREFDRVAIR